MRKQKPKKLFIHPLSTYVQFVGREYKLPDMEVLISTQAQWHQTCQPYLTAQHVTAPKTTIFLFFQFFFCSLNKWDKKKKKTC